MNIIDKNLVKKDDLVFSKFYVPFALYNGRWSIRLQSYVENGGGQNLKIDSKETSEIKNYVLGKQGTSYTPEKRPRGILFSWNECIFPIFLILSWRISPCFGTLLRSSIF